MGILIGVRLHPSLQYPGCMPDSSSFNTNLSGFALRNGMSTNYEKCVPGNKEKLLYWPILNFYREIWRTHKKTESASWILRGLTTYLDFDQELLCKSVHKHVKHA
jgi:hypothetical protein